MDRLLVFTFRHVTDGRRVPLLREQEGQREREKGRAHK